MNNYITRIFPPPHTDVRSNDYELSHVVFERRKHLFRGLLPGEGRGVTAESVPAPEQSARGHCMGSPGSEQSPARKIKLKICQNSCPL